MALSSDRLRLRISRCTPRIQPRIFPCTSRFNRRSRLLHVVIATYPPLTHISMQWQQSLAFFDVLRLADRAHHHLPQRGAPFDRRGPLSSTSADRILRIIPCRRSIGRPAARPLRPAHISMHPPFGRLPSSPLPTPTAATHKSMHPDRAAGVFAHRFSLNQPARRNHAYLHAPRRRRAKLRITPCTRLKLPASLLASTASTHPRISPCTSPFGGSSALAVAERSCA